MKHLIGSPFKHATASAFKWYNGPSGCFWDEFTNTNGVDLTDHTPTLEGIQWTTMSGAADWEIESNQAEQKSTAAGRTSGAQVNNPIVYSAEVAAGCVNPQLITGDITINDGGFGYEAQCGFICRYEDANNYWMGCISIDNSGGLFAEIHQNLAGVWTLKARPGAPVIRFAGVWDSGTSQVATLTNTATDITFACVGSSITFSTTDRVAYSNSGIYAEVKDAGAGTGAASIWQIDNFRVQQQ